MKVQNNTSVDIFIDGNTKIEPNASYDKSEMMFDTVNIHSDIGSCVIWTEYSQRSFICFGSIVAKESRMKDRDNQGLKYIVITERRGDRTNAT